MLPNSNHTAVNKKLTNDSSLKSEKWVGSEVSIPVYEINISNTVWKDIYEEFNGDTESILNELETAGDLPDECRLSDSNWMYDYIKNLIYILDCGCCKAYALRINQLEVA
ncbi:MAG: hypothetical protein LBS76_05080 [Mycoplasmataceae bacterium]|jgi:hypothetical protein|nr:hypothetical protein [Mycoplasmataceae bacterium]